jgi:hypothetical protein
MHGEDGARMKTAFAKSLTSSDEYPEVARFS